jgi:ATP-dependent protease Clp ATPase subunit
LFIAGGSFAGIEEVIRGRMISNISQETESDKQKFYQSILDMV